MTKEEVEAQIRETEKKLRELKQKEAFKKETAEQLEAIEEIKELKEKGELTGPGGFEANGLKPEGGDIHGTPGVKKAAEIQTPSGNQRGIIILWDDNHVTMALGDENGHGSAYTTSKPEGSRVFYMSQAWAAGLGHKIKTIPME
ncbi:unnamed protein product [marine sediment metagenome]|uniref:Uncharacterized protein n=1 Tax=marine sediment metagenome TaxID=412755 RepID=X1P769_9ZZZZ